MTPSIQTYDLRNPSVEELREIWWGLSTEEKLQAFSNLRRPINEDFFLSLDTLSQSEIIMALPAIERRIWIRILDPDDLTDVIQQVPMEDRQAILNNLDASTKKEVTALLAYAEDEAGGLMNPRFARIRPDMHVEEAIKYLYKQAQSQPETMRYMYVLDATQQLIGVVSLQTLFMVPGGKFVHEVMETDVITAREDTDQEHLKQIFAQHGLMAIPVVDDQNRIKGIVTVDDIVGVVEEEATEDFQRLGAVEVLDAPYLKIPLLSMVKKRAGWLTILFVGEMFTATAMGYYEHEIARAVVLALFIPLIISSGGNSGSQASTLVVRAIALGEIRLRDWWRVLSRELLVGTLLGIILGGIGLLRITLWPSKIALYGEHYFLIGLTVATSLVGIVLWGSVSGSMLPFILKFFKLDPATASAPFVATLVDVSGLVIYFTAASFMLKGILL